DGQTCVFLADNSPYNFQGDSDVMKRIIGCDLLAFPYNGAASDYPICYSSIANDEALAIANAREEKRWAATCKFIDVVRPKALMPYSSDFAVCGPMAKEFAKLEALWWADKDKVAARYGERFGTPSFAVRDGSSLEISAGGSSFVPPEKAPPKLKDIVDRYFSIEPKTRELYSRKEKAELDRVIELASQHLFASAERHKLTTDWVFNIVPRDMPNGPKYVVDFRDKTVTEGPARPDAKSLTCVLDSGYLHAILTGRSHWNNAQLSFQLEWKRVPNEFDHSLYTSLNFFHVPRSMWKEFQAQVER
ncbi:MAG: hypothetical protein V4760_08565, partial [Bdellovibrionota bacterium]